jgi:beta-galactosidase/beta-glucuronidase
MNQKKTHPNYGLSKCKQENNFSETQLGPLPRAVLRPNAFYLLDGTWKFEVDPNDKGLSEFWFISHHYQDTATWPGSVESHIEKIQPTGKSWQDKITVWYEREFNLPILHQENTQNQSQLQLTFGACGYETMVWLNGHLLRTIEGEKTHFGEYTSFSYELDEKKLLENENRLTVRIQSSMDADTARGKQESSVYKRGGIWYQTYTGGIRSVWIETVEKNRLRSRVDVISFIDDNLVRFNLTTRIHDPGEYTITLKVYAKEKLKAKLVASDDYKILLAAGQKQQRLVIEIPNAKHWSPNSPNRYKLIAQITNSSGYVSEIETYFGLRKIETRGNKIFLNNKEIYLNGILYQPGVASYQEIEKHMFAIKKLGCNLVRIHIAGVDPRIYKLADKIGLLLWLEVPSPHRSSAKSRTNHRAELMRMLALIGTHPSVIIWSLYNEDWGIQDIATNEKTRNHIVDSYNFMQISFPQFLVIDNDGWQHICLEGRIKSDLLTAHLYTPDFEKWKVLLDKLVNGDHKDVAALPLIVGDPFFYRKQVPLVVSEWGGFGFKHYGGPKNDTERAKKITLFKNEMKKRGIAGDVYTQATNIEDEQNGLINFSTGELKVPENLLGK